MPLYGLSAVCQVDTYNFQMPLSGLSAVCQMDTCNFQMPLYGLSAVCQVDTYNFRMPLYGLSAVCQVETYNFQMPFNGLSAVCQVDTYNFQMPLYGLSAVCEVDTYNFQMPLLFFLSMGVSVLFARIISVHLKINKTLLSELQICKTFFLLELRNLQYKYYCRLTLDPYLRLLLRTVFRIRNSELRIRILRVLFQYFIRVGKISAKEFNIIKK
jgi:hypothetical protein